jgi:hypothetical protein
LEETVIALREYFHAEGAGPSYAELEEAADRFVELLDYFREPTAALEDAYDELWDAQNRTLSSG